MTDISSDTTTDEWFYDECGRILGVHHESHPVDKPRINRKGEHCTTSRTRWNHRHPGNGRYEGYGIIRKFGHLIQVCFHTPKINRTFTSKDEVLDLLRSIRSQSSS